LVFSASKDGFDSFGVIRVYVNEVETGKINFEMIYKALNVIINLTKTMLTMITAAAAAATTTLPA